MREIVIDTETTGLDPASGHRIVEIGCVELFNVIPTGQSYHVYLDPQRDMPEEAFRVHGLSLEFLTGKPKFGEVVEAFISFIADAPLVAHNAEFDMRFINAELTAHGFATIGFERVVDTLALARRRHPGSPNSLDALCQRYGVDLSRRTKHGALLDAEILAEVYAELMGGRQSTLALSAAANATVMAPARRAMEAARVLPSLLSEMELAAHAGFVESLGKSALWLRYLPAAVQDNEGNAI
ncbi:MAG TPA: DNA polymerase III subunit epsilon [Methylovirgula sp.]